MSHPSPSAPLPHKRYDEIDLLRGIACLMVVLFHYVFRGPAVGWSPSTGWPWLEDIARYGYLGVHLFFIISGFVIFMSAERATPRGFLASRVARLYPAFWIAVPLTAVITWLGPRADLKATLPHVLVNLTMVPHWFNVPFVDDVYWTLAVELQFYILIWLAVRLGVMDRIEWFIPGWLLLFVVDQIRPIYPLEVWACAKWAPFFVIGILSYRVRTKGGTPVRWALLAAAALMALFAVTRQAIRGIPSTGGGVDSPWVIGLALLAFVGIFIAIALGKASLRRSFWTVWAGLLTYPVYLLHEYNGYVLLNAVNDVVKQPIVSISLMMILVVAAAWLVNQQVELRLGPMLRRWVEGRGKTAHDANLSSRA